MEQKLKHLEFIQNIINRMARNSFVIKGWTLLLVAAFLAFIARIGDANLMLIAAVPVILFWALDGYYLHQERLFRALYNSVRELDESDIDFSMDTSELGYGEAMNWGMISWEVPLARYPDTYNKQPLMYAALASQKNYMSLYLMSVYAHSDDKAWFETRYKASGKRLNMGKSCVRFKRVDDLPLDLIAETIASTTVDEYISRYESARKK